jgi:hypothetical protein
MTTHDQQTYPDTATDFQSPRQEADPANQPLASDVSDEQVQSNSSDGQDPLTVQTQEVPASESAETTSERALFADDELAGLTARWDNVQAGFVDDPRDCVQKADGLVSDVVKQLTASFSDARTRLEEQWARGEEASTEDLRVALKQYREFFQRLLAV